MNKHPSITLIVPVYKVEAYIEKCILSIMAQTFTDYEVLIIDDGSPDDSINLAVKTFGNDSRFKILSKKNGGQGSARNLGLEHAQGKFLAFLDSDDSLTPTYLEKLHRQITLTNSDICQCDINYINEAGELMFIRCNDLEAYHQKNDILLTLGTISPFMWDKLYRKEVFNNMRFNEHITYEDVHLCFKLLYKKKLTHVAEPLYNYLQRSGSTMHRYDPKYLSSRLAIFESYKAFMLNEHILEKNKVYFKNSYLVNYLFYAAINFARYSPKYKNDITHLLKTVDVDIFNFRNVLILSKTDPKRAITLLLLKVSPALFKKLIAVKFQHAV